MPAPAPSPAPARAPAPLTETSAATAPAIGKAYSSDVTGDGPAPGERVHHLTVEAAEDAACAAVDAAAAAGGRKSKRPPFRRHTQALASHASGRLGEIEAITWDAKHVRQAAVPPSSLPASAVRWALHAARRAAQHSTEGRLQLTPGGSTPAQPGAPSPAPPGSSSPARFGSSVPTALGSPVPVSPASSPPAPPYSSAPAPPGGSAPVSTNDPTPVSPGGSASAPPAPPDGSAPVPAVLMQSTQQKCSPFQALSIPHHVPHRVLICWRAGCGRHSARQSGEPDTVEFYCCVPCAQLEGHSEPCDRAYS